MNTMDDQKVCHLRLRHHVAQVGTVETVTHLDHALKVDITLQLYRA